MSGVPKVTRSGTSVSPVVHSGESSTVSYEGPITVTILNTNGSVLASLFEITKGVNMLNVKLTRDEISIPTKNLTFMATNEVSNSSLSLSFAVAGQLMMLMPV